MGSDERPEVATNGPELELEATVQNPFEQQLELNREQLELSRRGQEQYDRVTARSMAASERTAAALEQIAASLGELVKLASVEVEIRDVR